MCLAVWQLCTDLVYRESLGVSIHVCEMTVHSSSVKYKLMV